MGKTWRLPGDELGRLAQSVAGGRIEGINATSAGTLPSIFCLDDWSHLATLFAGMHMSVAL